MIINHGYHKRVKFSCWGRAETINQDITDILKSMNMVSVIMGLESGTDRILKYLKGNNSSVEKNQQAVNLLKDAGIQTNADFIIGAPDETYEDILKTKNFIKKSRLDFSAVNILMPFPGTALWDYAFSKNLVNNEMDWSTMDFTKFMKKENSTPMLNKHLSREELYKAYKDIKRVCIYKSLKALPRSPWLNELPRLIYNRLLEKISKIFSQQKLTSK